MDEVEVYPKNIDARSVAMLSPQKVSLQYKEHRLRNQFTKLKAKHVALIA